MTTGKGAAIFGLLGPVLSPKERAFFKDYDPFGFILFGRNIETPAQVAALTADLRDAVGRDAPIMIDQEGGRVQRLRAPHWRDWQAPFDTVAEVTVAKGPEAAARAMELRFQLIASELRALGIDANCAPLGDIASDQTHPFLQNRCYGRDVETVTRIARAVADGMLAGGVLPVLKHIPGHGRSQMDTHFNLPTVTTPLSELRVHDFAPFRQLSDLPMAMTGHLIFSDCDPLHPATQSPEMIRLIREDIGFDGLLMTDDLNMEALEGDLGTRTRASLGAGVDIALHCKGDFQQMQEVALAAGCMTNAALARAKAALSCRIPAPDWDIPALEAELAQLTGSNSI